MMKLPVGAADVKFHFRSTIASPRDPSGPSKAEVIYTSIYLVNNGATVQAMP